MIGIQYVTGNVLDVVPKSGEQIMIPHVCNNLGAFGRGFALGVAHRYPYVKARYLAMTARTLGDVRFVSPDDGITFANMIAQNGLPSARKRVVIDYDALASCLLQVAEECDLIHARVCAPRFGCGYAGGEWDMVRAIVENTLIRNGISVTIYDFG